MYVAREQEIQRRLSDDDGLPESRLVGKLDLGNCASVGYLITADMEVNAIDRDTLTGSDNILSFETERYNVQPLIIRGPGAGAEVTAAGCFSDLLKLASYLGAPS